MVVEILKENSFHQFSEQNSEALSQFNSQSREYKRELDAWKSSDQFEGLKEEYVRLIILSKQSPGRSNAQFDPKSIKTVTRQLGDHLEVCVFGGTSEISARLAENGTGRMQRQLEMNVNGPDRESWKTWNEEFKEFRREFETETQRPLGDSLKQLRGQLVGDVRDYLSTSFIHFKDLGIFLTQPEFSTRRENIRYFLVVLAEQEFVASNRGDGFFNKIRAEWLEKLKSHPQDEVFNKFLEARMRDTNSGNREFLQWLRFIKRLIENFGRPVPDQDINSAISMIEIASWPKILQDTYFGFVSNELQTTFNSIRDGLRVYYKPEQDYYSPDITKAELSVPKKKKGNQSADNLEGNGQIETEVFQYPVATFSSVSDLAGNYRILGPEELEAFIAKQAKKLARNKEAMLDCCRAIVDSLRLEPRGWGTKKLSAVSATFGQTHLPVRSMDPQKRHLDGAGGMAWSMRIRPLYLLTEVDGQQFILLDGIYDHQDYEDRINMFK